MKAYLRSARIAPKKANLIAMMVRGMRVEDALTALSRTHKKGARMVEDLLKSAVANAEHNDKQHKSHLMIKSIIVNQGTAYSRGVPMARGRMRPMQKFLSHISITLGIAEGVHEEKMNEKMKKGKTVKTAKKGTEKSAPSTSQAPKNTVKDADTSEDKKETKVPKDTSSTSSSPSTSSLS